MRACVARGFAPSRYRRGAAEEPPGRDGEGASKSGPFYHLSGITGGDYGILKPGKKHRLQLCLVYRREYFGLIGDFYVYVLGVR